MDFNGYIDMFLKLLPKGRAWPRHLDSNLSKLLMPFADDAARLDARFLALMEEADPRTATELVATWEYVVGLPDACTPASPDIDDRRAAIWQKLTSTGGQSEAYFIEIAARLGYVISIHGFRPTCIGDRIGFRLYSTAWRFSWVVTLEGDSAPVLECVFNRLKPAETAVIFNYL